MRQRRSARVLLLDSEHRVLLLRFVIPRTDGMYEFWAAPGGAVEPGETDAEAAHRELQEELGIAVPVQTEVHTAEGQFEFGGYWNLSTDVFFAASWDGSTPTLTGVGQVEQEALREWRWWSVDDIVRSTQPIFPRDLASVLHRLGTIKPCLT